MELMSGRGNGLVRHRAVLHVARKVAVPICVRISRGEPHADVTLPRGHVGHAGVGDHGTVAVGAAAAASFTLKVQR